MHVTFILYENKRKANYEKLTKMRFCEKSFLFQLTNFHSRKMFVYNPSKIKWSNHWLWRFCHFTQSYRRNLDNFCFFIKSNKFISKNLYLNNQIVFLITLQSNVLNLSQSIIQNHFTKFKFFLYDSYFCVHSMWHFVWSINASLNKRHSS